MSHWYAVFSAAVFEGFILAVQSKTGVDASLSGITNIIFDALEPIVVEQTQWIFDYGPIIVGGIVFLSTFYSIWRVKIKYGLPVFLGITAAVYLIATNFS